MRDDWFGLSDWRECCCYYAYFHFQLMPRDLKCRSYWNNDKVESLIFAFLGFNFRRTWLLLHSDNFILICLLSAVDVNIMQYPATQKCQVLMPPKIFRAVRCTIGILRTTFTVLWFDESLMTSKQILAHSRPVASSRIDGNGGALPSWTIDLLLMIITSPDKTSYWSHDLHYPVGISSTSFQQIVLFRCLASYIC